jgi:hypothetical protein
MILPYGAFSVSHSATQFFAALGGSSRFELQPGADCRISHENTKTQKTTHETALLWWQYLWCFRVFVAPTKRIHGKAQRRKKSRSSWCLVPAV